MADPDDIIELRGTRVNASNSEKKGSQRVASRKFLSVWYRCCHVYGRMYPNVSVTAYEGRCPKCGATVRAEIGPGGTSRRAFEAG